MLNEDRCSWKRCRSEADHGIVVGTDKREYPICTRHWFELCEMDGTVSENIPKHAAKRSRIDEKYDGGYAEGEDPGDRYGKYEERDPSDHITEGFDW